MTASIECTISPVLTTSMKTAIIGAIVGAIVTASAVGLGYLLLDDSTLLPDIPQDTGVERRSGAMDLICELQLDLDGQLALGINANEPSRMALARIDFERASGWYQGRLSISEGRAGTLVSEGNTLTVTRPAMFQRFGVTITQETFKIDRATGSFTQTINLQDGRTISLIRGTCAKVIKPPF